mmetsp:Transcript_6690/g.12845  ORF Transcript_6690/g.12845 Transcript_6690/m.12845 type:complete len:134 (+) Transcript_6690:2-403(+)
MGPTTFLPCTHWDMKAHDAMNSSSEVKAAFLSTGPKRLGVMPAGACTLYDSRLLHGGGANRSPRRRWLFCVSFAPSQRLMRERDLHLYAHKALQLGVQTLGELERGVACSKDDIRRTELKERWISEWLEVLGC